MLIGKPYLLCIHHVTSVHPRRRLQFGTIGTPAPEPQTIFATMTFYGQEFVLDRIWFDSTRVVTFLTFL